MLLSLALHWCYYVYLITSHFYCLSQQHCLRMCETSPCYPNFPTTFLFSSTLLFSYIKCLQEQQQQHSLGWKTRNPMPLVHMSLPSVHMGSDILPISRSQYNSHFPTLRASSVLPLHSNCFHQAFPLQDIFRKRDQVSILEGYDQRLENLFRKTSPFADLLFPVSNDFSQFSVEGNGFLSLTRTSHEIERVKIVLHCSFFPNLKPVIKFLIAFSLTSEIDSVSLISTYLHMYDYLLHLFNIFLIHFNV